MAKTDTPLIGSLDNQQRTRLLEYAKRCAQNCHTEIASFRYLLEWRDKAYQRTLDVSAEQVKAQLQNRNGNPRPIQNLSVPIVMPQVESSVAYHTGVYLSKHPIFEVMSTPQNEDAALQLQTVIADQSIQYGWAREFIKLFRNGEKYNFAPAFVHWKMKNITNVVTSTEISSAGLAKINEAAYGGNRIHAVDPYNCFWNMQVAPAVYHEEGDYFGWNTLMNRIAFKRFVNSLDQSKLTNLRAAFESGYNGSGGTASSCMDVYVPEINPALRVNIAATQGINWLAWAGLEDPSRPNRIQYQSNYVVTPFICRALPDDFGKAGRTPTIYLAYIVNWKWVIYVEEIVSAHDYLPIFIMQPNEDGLGYQTQSLLDNALPFQDMASSLWNISLESKRRLIFDRLIYNPRFVDKKDIDVTSSVARIPLRNASQFKGDEIGKAVYQIPYREDNTNNNIQMSEQISQMADVASGQNKVQRGQFQKGNKSVQEFDTTMDNSNSRQQLRSMTIEHQFMQPVKETIKSNTLVFQKPGKVLNRDSKSIVDIDPVALRDQILEFKMTDGQLPIEQLLNPQLMMVFLQTAQAMPVMMTEYDVVGMFTYWMKLKGAYWLDEFKRDPAGQQQFLNMYQQTAQAENGPPQTQPVPGV